MVDKLTVFIIYFLSLILKAPAVKDGSPNPDAEDKPLASKQKRSAHPKLLRCYTFQEMTANTYAVNNLEYDLAGEVVLSPTSRAKFAFQKDSTESDKTSPGPMEFNIDLTKLI